MDNQNKLPAIDATGREMWLFTLTDGIKEMLRRHPEITVIAAPFKGAYTMAQNIAYYLADDINDIDHRQHEFGDELYYTVDGEPCSVMTKVHNGKYLEHLLAHRKPNEIAVTVIAKDNGSYMVVTSDDADGHTIEDVITPEKIV